MTRVPGDPDAGNFFYNSLTIPMSRRVSLFVPCFVPDLETVLRNAAQAGTLQDNSFACVISGSSRTADIEKILVQGAHGH